MKRFLIFLLILFQIVTAYGQGITVQAPNVVTVGEPFSLEFSSTEQYDNFTVPDLSSLNVMAGPVHGSSSVFVNGQGGTKFIVQYYVSAKAEGKITIGKAEMTVGGKTITSNPVTIDVVKAATPATPQQGGQQANPGRQNPSATISANDLYTRLELSRSNLYRGEALVASLKLYVKPGTGITGVTSSRLPTFTGFFSQEIDIPKNEAAFHRQNVNGVIYNVAVLKRYVLTPQQLGTLIVGPQELNVGVQIPRARRASQSFEEAMMNMMMDSPFDEVEKKVQSPSVSVNVKDLPGGAPASYQGAVGNFKIEATIDRTQTQANQAIAYALNISGTGNLKLIEEPKINFPPDFEKYDPKMTENIRTTPTGSTGSKKYEYALIPRSAGDFTIPGVEFSYFDPEKGTYISLKSNDLNIHVEKDPMGGGAATTSVPGINQQNIRHIGQDILFIKTTPLNAVPKGSLFFGSAVYWLLLLLLLAVFIIIYIVFKKRIKDSRNIALMRNKTANKVAYKRLKLSAKLLKDGNMQGFYEELLRAMWGYVGDKLNIPVANLSRDNAQETLQAHNVAQEDIDTFLNVIDEGEFARYAPGTGQSQMEYVYDNAIKVISKFEQTIRK